MYPNLVIFDSCAVFIKGFWLFLGSGENGTPERHRVLHSQLQGAHYFIKADKHCLCYCSSFPGKAHMTADPKTDSLGERVYLQD